MYLDWIEVRRRTAQARCTKCGSNGGRSGCIPTSSGSRLPLRVLHEEHAVRTLLQSLVPPRETGTMVRGSNDAFSARQRTTFLPQRNQRRVARLAGGPVWYTEG